MTAPLVRLLGTITLDPAGREPVVPARLDRVVLAHLVLAEGRSVPASDLVDAVWGPAPPAGARNALQVKISRLRRHLGRHGEALRHDQGSYRLVLPRDEVDVRVFDDLARAASTALADGRLDDAATAAARALELWQGTPFAEHDEHPRLVAARARLAERRSLLTEVLAEVGVATEADLSGTIDLLRDLLAEDPLRPRSRLLLMRALARTGRRAEALAVYDVGRRVLAEQTGLAPPLELQQEFERLLTAERQASHRERRTHRVRTVPAGATETARWLAREGAPGTALELALRGCWWWWLGGRRSEGRDLLEELVGQEAAGQQASAVLGAAAWLAVFDSVTIEAEAALAAGEDALRRARELGWTQHQALAAVLLAERLFQRGEPRRGTLLLRASGAHFGEVRDPWGVALVGLTEARADLQSGAVTRAAAGGAEARRAFERLDDPAGQMMAMDLLGYCAEVVGALPDSAQIHHRALALAREVDAPEWEATQLTRLGSVQALLGDEQSLATLEAAVELAGSIGSPAAAALASNGLGLARGLAGEHERAAEIHLTALAWYEQQGSRAGVSYTAGRLALELAATEDAARLAERGLDLGRRTGDPRAIAHGLEAVALTHEDAPTRARALGGARALRRRTRSPLPPVIASSLVAARQRLADELRDELPGHLRAGALEATALTALDAS